MQGTPAVYLGRIVEKKNFRAFVYGSHNKKKLVESWEEFEACMQSGIWFATIQDSILVQALQEENEIVEVQEKPKRKPKSQKVKEIKEDIKVDKLDEMVYEVKDGE